MLNLESARPSVKQILLNLEEFERLCLGERFCTPSKFREMNEELSVGAVLMLGKHRISNSSKGKRLYWKGMDNQEHDLGYLHEAKIMRDYPGFHAKSSLSLGNASVLETRIIPSPKGGNVTTVTMSDGSTGIGPNYRIALRNAALKMHLKNQFNFFSLSDLWKRVWGHA